MRQVEIEYLAQGDRHAGRSEVQTHNNDGLVMSPVLFHETTHTYSRVRSIPGAIVKSLLSHLQSSPMLPIHIILRYTIRGNTNRLATS